MSRFTAPAPAAVDVPLLRREVEAATGLSVSAGGRDGADLWVEFETTEGSDDIEVAETVRQTVAAHRPLETSALDQVLAKCERVRDGQASFTNAERDQILARLALTVARHLR